MTTETRHPETFDEAVRAALERGEAFIEQTYGPDALTRVDLDTLDLSNPFRCMLGQLEGNEPWAENRELLAGSGYSKALIRYSGAPESGSAWARARGFEAGFHAFDGLDSYGNQREEHLDYDTLTDLWTERVRRARQSGGQEV